jgi:cyclopropane-fatty-acyl-phospholipid synthase
VAVNRRNLLFDLLPRTRYGELTVVTPEGTTRRFTGDREGEAATFILKDWRAIDATLKRGDIGLGESYMANLWETPDLKSFLTFCQRNRDEFARLTRFDFVNTLHSRGARLTSVNSFSGSRKNISASYDYPPELYLSFSVRLLSYSSGWWEGKELSLDEAQVN